MNTTQQHAQNVLAEIKRQIAYDRAMLADMPQPKRRNEIPVGETAKKRQTLTCRILRLETAKMLCDWFARGVQPNYMSWSHVETYL
jgi:hypothetical protein